MVELSCLAALGGSGWETAGRIILGLLILVVGVPLALCVAGIVLVLLAMLIVAVAPLAFVGGIVCLILGIALHAEFLTIIGVCGCVGGVVGLITGFVWENAPAPWRGN